MCGNVYEYCHGAVKTPYFRHMDKAQCLEYYSEPETEEHLNGKRDLYEWIKKQPGVTDAILEGWLPETKQRPDIMFKLNGEQYVIEYQCTPIATEYVERHDLYKVAGIKDIWIAGTEKYLVKNMREKYLESETIGFYRPSDKRFIFSHLSPLDGFIRRLCIESKYTNITSYSNEANYFGYPLNHSIFFMNQIVPKYTSVIDCNAAIEKHNTRKQAFDDEEKDNLLKREKYIEAILQRYLSTKSMELIATRPLHISDQLYPKNSKVEWLDYKYSTHTLFQHIALILKIMNSRRKYLQTMNNLENILRNEIVGKYSASYLDFKEGEYIDVKYKTFTIRHIIKGMTLSVYIHDEYGYKRKNYLLFERQGYANYQGILEDIILYTNIIYENTQKIYRVVTRLEKYSANSWQFRYDVSRFNIFSIFLHPVDNDGGIYDSIGTFKIIAGHDPKIDIDNITDDELFMEIREYFTKRLRYFYKKGIENYSSTNYRLFVDERKVNH